MPDFSQSRNFHQYGSPIIWSFGLRLQKDEDLANFIRIKSPLGPLPEDF